MERYKTFEGSHNNRSCVYRYYAGDQEALFREAHLFHPQRRIPNPKPIVRAQTTTSCGAAASPSEEFICDICMLAYQLDVMHGLECGHLFCQLCWASYLKVMVMDEGRAQVSTKYFVLYFKDPSRQSIVQLLIVIL